MADVEELEKLDGLILDDFNSDSNAEENLNLSNPISNLEENEVQIEKEEVEPIITERTEFVSLKTTSIYSEVEEDEDEEDEEDEDDDYFNKEIEDDDFLENDQEKINDIEDENAYASYDESSEEKNDELEDEILPPFKELNEEDEIFTDPYDDSKYEEIDENEELDPELFKNESYDDAFIPQNVDKNKESDFYSATENPYFKSSKMVSKTGSMIKGCLAVFGFAIIAVIVLFIIHQFR
ncbi:MAG: hypothetical protein K2I42_03565 [Anaeroplasmataceae bacterium]|nr:hypothetical protein [Anaeroplasmataceae bacterium]